MLVTAPAEQLLAGYQLSECRCSYCKAALHDSDRITAYAVRYAGDDEWAVPRFYCRDCHPSAIPEPTLGATELLADGHLGRTMDGATQRTSVTLLGIERVTESAPEEGYVTL